MNAKTGERLQLFGEVREKTATTQLEIDAKREHSQREAWLTKQIGVMECKPFTERAGSHGVTMLEPGDLRNDPHGAPEVLPTTIVANVECTPWCWKPCMSRSILTTVVSTILTNRSLEMTLSQTPRTERIRKTVPLHPFRYVPREQRQSRLRLLVRDR